MKSRDYAYLKARVTQQCRRNNLTWQRSKYCTSVYAEEEIKYYFCPPFSCSFSYCHYIGTIFHLFSMGTTHAKSDRMWLNKYHKYIKLISLQYICLCICWLLFFVFHYRINVQLQFTYTFKYWEATQGRCTCSQKDIRVPTKTLKQRRWNSNQ